VTRRGDSAQRDGDRVNDAMTTAGDSWLAAQQAMWKALFPAASNESGQRQPIHEATPLEEQFNELRDTWQASVAKWTEFAKSASSGELPSPDQLREMFAPTSWTGPGAGVLDAALQRVLEGPRYATLWELDRKLLELQRLSVQRDKAVADYQAVVQKAWNLAFERFAKQLGATPTDGGKPTWRGLTDRWLAVANDTLIEAHRSDEFIQAQRRMLRAASDRHLQERRIAETWCEAMHVPTRSEVDELQRHVVELRREVRLLRRAVQSPATDSEATPRAGQSAKRPARPAARRARS
jgi:poly[(R)-3-hydroxyalkanoate] polymerase subunit PhaE